MSHLSGTNLQAAIAQLDQAIYNHEQWYKNVQRVLIARLPPDPADLQPDALRCKPPLEHKSRGCRDDSDHPA